MNRVLAILPLRSGSKRIKDKNIRVVGYYPLFYHIIKTCLLVPEIEKIIVSTDSLEYKRLVESYFGNEARVKVSIRPQNISSDNTKTEDVIQQILNKKKYFNNYKYVALVQATTPLTRPEDIKTAISEIVNNDYNSVFSVAKSDRFYLNDMSQLLVRPMTQNKLPELYETGCFWLINIKAFIETNNRIIKPYSYVTVDEKFALDIDDQNDMILADKILSEKVRSLERKYFQSRDMNKTNINEYFDEHKDPDGNIRNILFEKESRIEFAKDEINFINTQLKDDESEHRSKLLSIGLGGGYAEELISSRFIKYAIEPDTAASAIASEKVDFIYNDSFENVEFDSEFFDVIFAHHVIEHIKNPILFIKKISKILKIGGKLVIGTPNFDSAAARRYGKNFRLLNDPTHISLFSEVGLRELLEDYGFLINYVDYPYFKTKFFNKEDLLKMLDQDGVSPPFYGSIMTFYATKK